MTSIPQTGQANPQGKAPQPTTEDKPIPKSGREGGRGFASMDAARQREIASLGGRAAHQSGNAHQFTSAEARAAGSKGGQASRVSAGNGKRQADKASAQDTSVDQGGSRSVRTQRDEGGDTGGNASTDGASPRGSVNH